MSSTAFSQVPSIDSFFPNNGFEGTIVTINGTNFSKNKNENLVYFGAVKADILSVTTTKILVKVPVSATYGSLTVTTNGLTAYSPDKFVLTFKDNERIDSTYFSERVDLVTYGFPREIELSDLNGDGKNDLITTQQSGDVISVSLNVTNSPAYLFFSQKQNFKTGSNPFNIAIGDLDGDGRPDVAISIFNSGKSGSVAIFRNTSTMQQVSFEPPVNIDAGFGPTELEVRDLNADGKPDLAVVSGNSNGILLLKNTYTGNDKISFEQQLITLRSRPVSLTISNLNDGDMPELIVSTEKRIDENHAAILIFENKSLNQKFDFQQQYEIATSAGGYVVADDLNSDSRPEIIITNEGLKKVSIFINTTNGKVFLFRSEYECKTENNPASISVGDLNGDDRPDLAVVNRASNTISVFNNISNNGVVKFSQKINLNTELDPTNVKIGDLNLDSRPEIIVSNAMTGSVSIFKNQKSLINDTIPTAAPFIDFIKPDKGRIGSIVTIYGSNFSTSLADNIVYFGGVKAKIVNADTAFLKVEVPVGASHQLVTVTTGYLTGYSPKFFTTVTDKFTFISSASFGLEKSIYSGKFPGTVSQADINTDGKLDLIATNYTDKSISIFENSSSDVEIKFKEKVNLSRDLTVIGSHNMTGDLNGDGKIDIVCVSDAAKLLSVFLNTSTKDSILFEPVKSYPTGTYPVGVALHDLDGDGRTDIIVTANYGSSASIFRNISSGGKFSLAPRIDFITGDVLESVSVSDLNNDRKPDLIVTNYFANSVSILKNISVKGKIDFDKKLIISTGPKPLSTAISDFDGDGKSDIAVTSSGSEHISILKNISDDGQIAFADRITFHIGTSPNNIAVDDLNGDGKPDLAVSSSEVEMFVLENESRIHEIAFTGKKGYYVSGSSSDVTIADLNGDGYSDIIAANLTDLKIFRNKNSGVKISPQPIISSFKPNTATESAEIIIKGSNLSTTTLISFGGYAAKSFSIYNDSTIAVVVGKAQSGDVKIITQHGSAAARGFYYVSKPLITAEGPIEFFKGKQVLLTTDTGNFSYQWLKNHEPISGANNNTYYASETAIYQIEITRNGLSVRSEPIQVKTISKLPNLKVLTIAKSCKNTNNGSIAVYAAAHLNYIAILTKNGISSTYKFTDSLKINDLNSGNYKLSISVEGDSTYQKEYDLVISEPKDLSLYTVIDHSDRSIKLTLDGNLKYHINMNGNMYVLTSNYSSLPLQNGMNKLIVSTDIPCQGVIERNIFFSDHITIFPNPAENLLNIKMNAEATDKVELKIYTIEGSLKYFNQSIIKDGLLKLDISNLRSGIYILKVSRQNSENVIKFSKL